ncbi:dihydroxyacetone kinase subunit DhaL [Acuticoccus sp. I52.16.1]|uniref:dihydroxyacetone kinase subunit DhaL n=1 Tax=Acuticoccus sp. I52.16.1 TaxID=2928472 RepID=UPI001FD42443|nr:dihydroxyacetone kinase subunit DhaL [Acuticoccus sp. I52.16.1]UOM35775.1 dihydroxyacetone kinase subunit L [Acuticoccus sp. I52.16.1]
MSTSTDTPTATDAALIGALIAAAGETIAAHRDALSELDRAIGDGDHGHNMARGFEAVTAIAGELAALPFGKALAKAGTTLVMKVGGASGPLYGSALMAAGKVRDDAPASLAEVVELLDAAVDAVKKRGKADVGAKTMLDVLVPLADALRAGPADPVATARDVAAAALEATGPMTATKGRAAFLGERSVGHLDPGARSTQLLTEAVCTVMARS